MKGQKTFSYMMGLMLSLLFLFGSATPVAATETTQLLTIDEAALNAGLEKPGVLRVGMEANYAPFNWSQTTANDGGIPISNSEGEYANGYDAQVAQQVADQLGLDLEIVKLEWDGLPPALESGKIDAIIAGMSPTPERLEQINFSDSYYQSDIVLVVRSDSQYAAADDLTDFTGARVTGQLNTFHYDLITQIPDVSQETAMESFPTMITSLTSDKLDAYVSEKPGAMAAVAANSDLTYVEFADGSGFDLGDQTSAIAVGLRKDSPLTEPINAALANISEAERDSLMTTMVDLNMAAEDTSFWGDVKNVWETYSGQFIRGAANTLLIALVSTVIGFIIGLIIAIIRSLKVNAKNNPLGYGLHAIVDFILVAYIEIFRGTPMMVQAMMIYYGSKLFFNIDMSAMAAAFLIVSVNTGAYLAEVIRGGIVGVDKGQSEAAKAIGMNHFQSMSLVILPQAIRSILPTIGNEFVINIKDTSVLNVIAVTELFFVTKSAAGSTYLTFQTFLIASIIYFVLTFTTTRLLRLVEKRMTGSDNYTVYQSSIIDPVKGDK